jgi:FkbM family methyltransferase
MLIPLSDLVARHNLKVSGILHVGAHKCEELPDYLKLGVPLERIIWVEANADLCMQARQNIPGVQIYNLTVTDTDGKACDFIITNNGESSSILELGTHKMNVPWVVEVERRHQKGKTLDTFCAEEKIPPFNFVNMDIQGAELQALKGMRKALGQVDYLYLEVNIKPVYVGCALLDEIEAFLQPLGFRRVELCLTGHDWGDAFYIRAPPLPAHTTWSLIDRLVYINVPRRTDRRDEMEAEFKRLDIPREKLERFYAIERNPPFLGCSLSHLTVVKQARERKFQNVLILEDDFDFHPDASLVHSRLQEFMKTYGETYNMVLLASNTFKSEPCIGGDLSGSPMIVDYVRDAQTCAGYLISARFFDALIDCWEKAYVQLERTGNHGLYMCDMSWKQLQTGPTYVFRPRLGYQRISRSDLGQSVNDYTWQLQCPAEDETMADLSAATVASKKNPIAAHAGVYQAIQVARLKDKFRQVLRLYEAYNWSGYTGEGSDFGLWDELSIAAYYLRRWDVGVNAIKELLRRVDLNSVTHIGRLYSQKERLKMNLQFYSNPELLPAFDALLKKSTVISAYIMGGLGNQLFQIATALALSYDYGCQAVFERITESESSIGTRPVYWETIFHQIKALPRDAYRQLNFTVYPEPQRPYKSIPVTSGQALCLKGFWQSAKYFDKYRDKLLTLFRPPSMEPIEAVWKSLPEAKFRVSLHVRRTDQLVFSHLHTVLNMTYYQRAVEYFPPDTQFLIFSDDIPWCQANFDWLPNKQFITSLSDVTELFLMSYCNGHILACSTFSWWGAYLNPKQVKVFAPKEWFGPAFPGDWSEIFQPGWTIVSHL